jgi:hypothetical protein
MQHGGMAVFVEQRAFCEDTVAGWVGGVVPGVCGRLQWHEATVVVSKISGTMPGYGLGNVCVHAHRPMNFSVKVIKGGGWLAKRGWCERLAHSFLQAANALDLLTACTPPDSLEPTDMNPCSDHDTRVAPSRASSAAVTYIIREPLNFKFTP